jgi:hypothetical protein
VPSGGKRADNGYSTRKRFFPFSEDIFNGRYIISIRRVKASFDEPDRQLIKRIYDQVSLRDHVKSDCFQNRNHAADSVTYRGILFLPGAEFKQLFRRIEQGQR